VERTTLFCLTALCDEGVTEVIPELAVDCRLVAPLWLLAYVALYGLISALTWHYGKGSSENALVLRLRSWPHWGTLGRAARLVSGVGLCYAAIICGVISPMDTGLAGIDWLSGIGKGIGWGVASFLLLTYFIWGHARGIRGDEPPLSSVRATWGSPVHGLARSLADEGLWAFYRGVSIPWLGRYPGAYVGLALALAIPCLSPWTRAALRQAGDRETLLLDVCLAIISTTCYVLTANLWICLALHALLAASVSSLLAALPRSRTKST